MDFKPDDIKRYLASRRIPASHSDAEQHYAAVAMIMTKFSGQWHVLYIRRAYNENDPWSGHIAFPGGRVDATDQNHRITAEREVDEELGFALTEDDYTGFIGQFKTRRRDLKYSMEISAFAYVLESVPSMTLDKREVAEVIWRPVEWLTDTQRMVSFNYFKSGIFQGINLNQDVTTSENKLTRDTLWGITYKVTQNWLTIMQSVRDK